MWENPTLTSLRRGPPGSEYLHEVLRLCYKQASSTVFDGDFLARAFSWFFFSPLFVQLGKPDSDHSRISKHHGAGPRSAAAMLISTHATFGPAQQKNTKEPFRKRGISEADNESGVHVFCF